MSTCYCWTSGPMCCRNQQWQAAPWMPYPVAWPNHFAIPVFKWNATAALPLTVEIRYVENNGVNP